MPASHCQDLVEHYLGWLRGQFAVVADGENCLIETPFLAPDGDHIRVKVLALDGDVLRLSDEGQAYDHLFLAGINPLLPGSARRAGFEMALAASGVEFDEQRGEIVTQVTPQQLSPSLHRLVRAVSDVQHLILTARESPSRVFRDEVSAYFQQEGLGFAPDVTMKGKSETVHHFDYGLFRKDRDPLLVRALSTPSLSYTRHLAMQTAFAYLDVREAKQSILAITLLDDRVDVWRGEPLKFLETYSDYVVMHSRIEEIKQVIAA